jgi:hypothetical protein
MGHRNVAMEIQSKEHHKCIVMAFTYEDSLEGWENR